MVQILLIFGGIASIRAPQFYKMNSVVRTPLIFHLKKVLNATKKGSQIDFKAG
jgi:hypothetical protein